MNSSSSVAAQSASLRGAGGAGGAVLVGVGEADAEDPSLGKLGLGFTALLACGRRMMGWKRRAVEGDSQYMVFASV
jgi:hypothetical protein